MSPIALSFPKWCNCPAEPSSGGMGPPIELLVALHFDAWQLEIPLIARPTPCETVLHRLDST